MRTFWCWVWQIFQANTSCREVVRQLQALLGVLEHPDIDPDSSVYCQARAKLSLPLLEKAFGASVLRAQSQASRRRLLQGRPIKFVDVSTVRLEDTPANRQEFPPTRNQLSRPNFPLLKLLVLFGLDSGAVLARATGTKQAAGTRLLLSLREHLRSGDILGGDRSSDLVR